MNIHFTGHNFEVTAVLKDLITKKLERIKPSLENASVNIILTVEYVTNIVEANVHIKGKDINAKGTADDMYKAIDVLIKKLEGQLRKIKEKKHCGCHCERIKDKVVADEEG